MVDVDKLRGKITERRMNAGTVAEAVGINKATFYRRINSGGGSFTVDEAYKVSRLLGLTLEEVNQIFFAQYVA